MTTSSKTNKEIKRIWLPFQNYIPCVECENECPTKHKACTLWNRGWRVGVRHFWFIKWLEFTNK